MDSNVETSNFDRKTPGRVYLVGAGPGDPELITLRGIVCLRRADLILYDYLVGAGILRHASPTAQKECLGQHGRGKLWTQDETPRMAPIETALIRRALPNFLNLMRFLHPGQACAAKWASSAA